MGWKSKEAKSDYDRKRYEQKTAIATVEKRPESTVEKIPEKRGGQFNTRVERVLKWKYPLMVKSKSEAIPKEIQQKTLHFKT